jgi:hypothetical protein
VSKLKISYRFEQGTRDRHYSMRCYPFPKDTTVLRSYDTLLNGDQTYEEDDELLSGEMIDDLLKMLQALTELQADLESTFVLPPETNLADFFKDDLATLRLINKPGIQKHLERHKMDILRGLAWLKKY